MSGLSSIGGGEDALVLGLLTDSTSILGLEESVTGIVGAGLVVANPLTEEDGARTGRIRGGGGGARRGVRGAGI